MLCNLIIVKYPKYLGLFGMLSMAVFRLPLALHKRISFYKLLGCGKNGTFDTHPDWRQWGVLTVYNGSDEEILPSFIQKWWRFFHCEVWSVTLQPIEGHGTWDQKNCFGALPKQTPYEGLIAVLTRASIRVSKLRRFWSHVPAVAHQMRCAKGFITSVGIGEVPWVKGATFSIWDSKALMKQFAYSMQEHADVVVKTKKERWYSEEMFVRFIPLSSSGSLNGFNPLQEKL
ncbi:MAG: spheroidene monooxygenase [Bacteroidota bacterium]|nr:spheroidene monooxygenase [Bacteroidota bacterium]